MSLLQRLRKPAIEFKPFSLCETVHAGTFTPYHLRPINPGDALYPGGGLSHRGIKAACGAEVAWDRAQESAKEIREGLALGRESINYCSGCLSALGLG